MQKYGTMQIAMTRKRVKNLNHYEDKDKLNQQSEEATVHRSRRKKKEEEKENRHSSKHKRSAKSAESAAIAEGENTGGKKKKYRMNWKQFAKFICCAVLLVGVAGIIYVTVVITQAPKIETDNIYSMLSQSSVLYDDEEEVMDSIFGSDGENRTIVSIDQIPDNLQNAFIALEDKTFKTHSGFNIIRIFGAIKDALVSGDQISGTSTITQQLARNLYLEDSKSERSLNRKIKEAYYAVILEQKLSKDEIMEAYLNTIYFGMGGYGVQAASQAYFSKDVSELSLVQCAALAAMPQLPSEYELVKQVSANDINDETTNLILKDGDVAYVWNDSPAVINRIHTCLGLMLEQGYITQEEYDEALATEVKDMVNPNIDAFNTSSNYFADYVIQTVIEDLQEEYGYDYAKASEMVYSGGLKIYTTMNSEMQNIVEDELNDGSNYPAALTGTSRKDSNGNIIDENGNVVLYSYSNYITSKGYFRLKSSEYEWNDDGSLTVFKGKRLNLYDTTVQGASDVSVEFKNMYIIEDGVFYTISGGYVNIPQTYKSKDSDGNLVISANFFTDYPDFFEEDGDRLATKGFTLQQRVIQPQAAMTIVDNETGYVKAMVGGRNVNGRMILNRAVSYRQPGSSIKPLAVYSAALQRSYELEAAGQSFPISDSKVGKQGDALWGNYITAGSVIDDEPTTINGKVWPQNSGGGYNGLVTFRRALQLSLNICAVKILEQVGTDYSFDLVEKYGVTSLVRDGEVNDNNLAALALGGLSRGVSTLEMASAYSTFVNDGVHKSYNVYTKVTNRNGDMLLEAETTETEVLNSGVAWIMRDLLQSVVTNGLGTPAAVSGARAGGKTGTTDEQFDIWFDGFTAKYSASLWIGCDVNMKLSSMSNATAALWGKIMNQIPDVGSGTYSAKPSNVISVSVDSKSGMLASDKSGSDAHTEYFTSGTQPTESGTLRETVEICADSGYLATPSCPNVTEESGIMRPYEPNSKVGDYKKELPHYYCNQHNPDPSVYPVKEGEKVTIVEEPPEEPEVPTDPSDPNNPADPDNPNPDNPNPEDPNNPTDPDNPNITDPGAAAGILPENRREIV